MGLFEGDLKIVSPVSPSREVTVQLMVDTGATLTSVPRAVLQSMGVQPVASQTFVLGNGQQIQRDAGSVLATLDGVTMPIPVMFAEGDDAAVLGATALEIMGFVVDPVEKKLVPRNLMALSRRHSGVRGWRFGERSAGRRHVCRSLL